MTPKGANLEGTDLLEVSTLESGSYVTRSITGQEIIDAASGTGVTNITVNAPLATTGGTTPDLSISEADGTTDGFITAVDWSTFNSKQAALVSGTNIKTIEGQSLLGAGNINLTATDVGLGNVDNTSDLNKPISTATQTALNAKQDTLTLTTTGTSGAATLVGATLNIPQYSGGGGGGGVHGAMIRSGVATSYIVNSLTSYSATSTTNLRLAAVPFIPIKTFTTASFYINVGTSQVAAIARILIYSELNGLPDQKLYESANLDLSSAGIKTATTSFTFTAGTTYFVCTHTQGTAGVTHIPATSLMPISIGGISTPTTFFSSTVSWAIGSAPTTFGSVNSLTGATILVGITSA
jgi:hypothetical protein